MQLGGNNILVDFAMIDFLRPSAPWLGLVGNWQQCQRSSEHISNGRPMTIVMMESVVMNVFVIKKNIKLFSTSCWLYCDIMM